MGRKKKAHSWDNIADIIFTSRVYKRMIIADTSFDDFIRADNNSEAEWIKVVESRLSLILTNFFNHLLSNNLPLPAR